MKGFLLVGVVLLVTLVQTDAQWPTNSSTVRFDSTFETDEKLMSSYPSDLVNQALSNASLPSNETCEMPISGIIKAIQSLKLRLPVRPFFRCPKRWAIVFRVKGCWVIPFPVVRCRRQRCGFWWGRRFCRPARFVAVPNVLICPGNFGVTVRRVILLVPTDCQCQR